MIRHCIAFLMLATTVIAQDYTVTDLGSLDGGSSFAYGLNNMGSVVGESELNVLDDHAYVWSKGQIADLGLLSVQSRISSAWGINSSDTIIGQSYKRDIAGPLRAVVWQRDGDTWNIAELPTLGGGEDLSRPSGINAHGQIVGLANTNSWPVTSAMWEKAASGEWTVSTLEIGGGTTPVAYGINDQNQIIGEVRNHSGAAVGAMWEHNGIDWAFTALGRIPNASWSRPFGINNHGQVVGISYLDFFIHGSDGHAFLWEDDQITDLGTLPGYPTTTALSVNDGGDVVGTASDGFGDNRAFLWRNGDMIDLNALVPPGLNLILISANDINDAGQIIAIATEVGPSLSTHSLLLTPDGLFISALTPGFAGRSNEIEITGANSSADVAILYGTERGNTPISGCSGVSVGISNPIIQGYAETDLNGSASRDAWIPPRFSDQSTLIQAVDYANCEVSNLVVQVITGDRK